MRGRPVYPDLTFPLPPDGRPWTVMNMVTTIDGKSVTGTRDEHVADLGSQTDHETMRAIEGACGAVLIGAGSLRATPGLWYPERLMRFVATASGNLDPGSRFFSDAPGKAWAVTTPEGAGRLPAGVQALVTGPPVDWVEVMERVSSELDVQCLLVEGGSELNAALLHEDLVDELFWTVAPKVRLGRDVPTYADGEALPRSGLLAFRLVSHVQVGDEVFLRYRRARDT